MFAHYPGWLYLLLYSLPTLSFLVAALEIQIFTNKCLFVAWHLSKSDVPDPLRDKLQGRQIEKWTYIVTALIVFISFMAFMVSWLKCDIGAVNRIIITLAYTLVMFIVVGSAVFFLCVIKAKYGQIFKKERLQVRISSFISHFVCRSES